MAIKIVRNIPPFDTANADKKFLYISGSTIKFDTAEQIGLDSRYVTTSSFDPFSGSIKIFTASQQTLNAALNSFSASSNTLSASLKAFTGSLNIFTASVNTFSASQLVFNNAHNSFSASINTFTASQTTLNSAYNSFSATFNTFSSSVNVFSASQLTLNAGLNGFTASFSASVRSIGDVRYILTSSNYVQTVNQFTGNVTFAAGTNVTISSGSNVITINATAASSGTVFADDRYVLTSSLTSSVINVGDRRYTLTSSYDLFTGSFSAYSASVNTFTASQIATNATQATLNSNLNSFTASFSSSVRFLGDSRYVFTSSFDVFTASINTFSQSVNTLTASFKTFSSSVNVFSASQITLNNALNAFSASINSLTQSLNGHTASFTASVILIGDGRYVLTSQYNPFGNQMLAFSASQIGINFTQSSYNANLGGFTSSFSASVQSIGDARYTQTVNAFSGTVSIVAGPNITVNSGSGQIVITGSAGAVTTILNGLSGTISILAGPNITINSGSGFIMITGSAGGSGSTDISALNSFSQSVNSFTASFNILSQSLNAFSASHNSFTQSINSFTSSFSASVIGVADGKYLFTSSFAVFTGTNNAFTQSIKSFTASFNSLSQSLNIFSASHNTFSQSINSFTSSFSASVIGIADGKYVFTSSFAIFTGSTNAFTQSVNSFTASFNTLSQSLNGFTASFTSSVQFIADRRYTSTINGYTGSIAILAGPNITINSGSGFIMITGSPGAVQVTGSDNFFVTNLLKVSGSVVNPIGHLILSSTVGSTIAISGNLKSTANGRILSDTQLIFSASSGRAIYSSSIIIPSGGGSFFGGNGIVVGYHTPTESIHVVDGNMRIEGTGDLAYIIKSHDLVEEPQFRMGSIIYGGDGDPNCRFIYSDISSSERSVFEFDKKGIAASIKQAYGTHFEGFISGEVNPLFRLNSSPSMSLEFGRGDDSWTDVILRRYDEGRLHLLSQLSGGQATTGSLNVANIYHSLGHLILSSTFGTVTVSGNLNVLGNISALTGLSGGSGGGPVTGSSNFFVQQILDISGTIRNPVGEINLTSSGMRTIHTGSIILPVGGGTSGGGYGIAIGANLAFDALHIVNGNARIEGSNEYSYMVKRTDMTNGPQFQFGRLAGDGDPKIRFMYEDSVTSERSVFDVTKSGTVGSIKPAGIYGSHFEGYISGDTQPMFRLNSFPSMSLEFGSGSTITTDVIMRRKKAGHLEVISQLTNGTRVTGNLDVANIYSSDGHLHLSSTFGTVTVSGNLKVEGEIYGYKAAIPKYVGLTYTFSSSDSGKIIELTASTGTQINCYLPENMQKGFNATIVQFASASLIHFSRSGGSTLSSYNNLSKSAGWYSQTVVYVSENPTGISASWVLGGALV